MQFTVYQEELIRFDVLDDEKNEFPYKVRFMCVKENKLELSVKYIGSYGKIIYPFPRTNFTKNACLEG